MERLKGYENYYMINKEGQLFSIRKNRLIKCFDNGIGYYQHCLIDGDGKKKWKKIHRLVALQYLDNPNNYTDVNHKDGDKSNNNLNNLEWLSHSDNVLHSYRVLGRVK